MATIWEADGESAGSTPWEFDSLVEESGATLTLDAAAKRNGSYGYNIAIGAHYDCYGVKALSDLTEFYARIAFKLVDIDGLFDYDRLYLFWMKDGATNLMWLNLAWHSGGWGVEWRIYGQADDYSVIDLAANNVITDTAWHWIEIYYKYGGSANGLGKGWIDGYLQGSMSNMTHQTGSAVDTLWVGPCNYGATFGSGDYFYIDDVLFDTAEIGPYYESGVSKAKQAATRSLLLHSF